MKSVIVPRSLLMKGFVKQHQRAGKTVGPYFTKTKKKIADVRHIKKTRVDLSGAGAKAKIEALETKKKLHDEHIDHATVLKAEVEKHKSSGNTHYHVGKTKHHVDTLLTHLNDHIDHHSNEKKSHHNHIEKIKDRHETEARYWEKKSVVVAKKNISNKSVVEKEYQVPKMPELEGSQNQVKWASDIRKKAIGDIEKKIDESKDNSESNRLKKKINEFAEITNASYFIEKRDTIGHTGEEGKTKTKLRKYLMSEKSKNNEKIEKRKSKGKTSESRVKENNQIDVVLRMLEKADDEQLDSKSGIIRIDSPYQPGVHSIYHTLLTEGYDILSDIDINLFKKDFYLFR